MLYSIFRPLMIFALLTLAYPVFAQRDTDSSLPGSSFEISGQVRSANGRQVVNNVIVRLERSSGGLVDQRATDSTGRFRFSRLTPAQYTVSASLPGLAAAPQQVDVNRFIPRIYVILELVPEKETFRRKEAGPAGLLDVRTPKQAARELEEGRAALASKKVDQAIIHLEKAISIYPAFFEAQLLLGTTYMNERQWDKAELALRRTLEIKPRTIDALVYLGEVHRRQKKYADAEKVLQEALKIDNKSWQGHFTLGRVYWEKGEALKAGPHIGQTLQLMPDLAEAHLLAGNIFVRASLPENAIVEYKEYLRLAPKGEFAETARVMVQKIERSLAEKKK